MAIVINRKYDDEDVYIGKSSVWGNPYRRQNPTLWERNWVIEEFRKYLWRSILDGRITIDMLVNLHGKKLGCFCKPKACHGDVIVKAVSWALKERYGSQKAMEMESAIESLRQSNRFKD